MSLRPLASTLSFPTKIKNSFLQHIITPTTTSPFLQQQQQQTRFFSKYLSKSTKKRLPLNTKWAGKGYVKGKRCTKEGKSTSKGRFIVDFSKRLKLMVPENYLEDTFKLKPYIAAKITKIAPELRRL